MRRNTGFTQEFKQYTTSILLHRDYGGALIQYICNRPVIVCLFLLRGNVRINGTGCCFMYSALCVIIVRVVPAFLLLSQSLSRDKNDIPLYGCWAYSWWGNLKIQEIHLCIKSYQVEVAEAPYKDALWSVPARALSGTSHWPSRPRTCWRVFILQFAGDYLKIPQEELNSYTERSKLTFLFCCHHKSHTKLGLMRKWS